MGMLRLLGGLRGTKVELKGTVGKSLEAPQELKSSLALRELKTPF